MSFRLLLSGYKSDWLYNELQQYVDVEYKIKEYNLLGCICKNYSYKDLLIKRIIGKQNEWRIVYKGIQVESYDFSTCLRKLYNMTSNIIISELSTNMLNELKVFYGDNMDIVIYDGCNIDFVNGNVFGNITVRINQVQDFSFINACCKRLCIEDRYAFVPHIKCYTLDLRYDNFSICDFNIINLVCLELRFCVNIDTNKLLAIPTLLSVICYSISGRQQSKYMFAKHPHLLLFDNIINEKHELYGIIDDINNKSIIDFVINTKRFMSTKRAIKNISPRNNIKLLRNV